MLNLILYILLYFVAGIFTAFIFAKDSYNKNEDTSYYVVIYLFSLIFWPAIYIGFILNVIKKINKEYCSN